MHLLWVLDSLCFGSLVDDPLELGGGILLQTLGTGVFLLATAVALVLLFLVSSQFYLVVFVSLLFGCLLGLGVAVQLVKLVI